jgi:parvulin-like peptidyl-prolyl isomerase
MKCISWFKALIAENGLEGLKKEFKMLAEQQGGYFMPNHLNYDSKDESVFYVDIENDDKMLSNSYSFSQFVDKRIDEEYSKVIVCISEFKNSAEQNDIITSLKSQLDSLIYLNSTLNILGKTEKIQTRLENIVNYIKSGSSSTTQISQSETNLVETFFGFKGKRSEIRPLYNSLEILSFFNPDNNQYETFHQILTTPTSTMVVNLQTSITVSCDNYRAAYILSKIEPLFSRLNFRSIEKSGIIKNRLGNPFTESSLSKAKTIFKQRTQIDDTLKDEIDRVLNPLFNKR